MTSFRHDIRVRYGEVDMQRIVFNAHYLAYVDDACDSWMRSMFDGSFESAGFDFVLKRADVTWHGSATIGEVIAIDVSPARWGSTSFDVQFDGAVGDRPVFSAVVTYVSVTPGTTAPVPTPTHVRARIGEPAG
jgi:YbgC/YbaW family acyl-CoA thioester hydrolase